MFIGGGVHRITAVIEQDSVQRGQSLMNIGLEGTFQYLG